MEKFNNQNSSRLGSEREREKEMDLVSMFVKEN
jgi:hypothetical protein